MKSVISKRTFGIFRDINEKFWNQAIGKDLVGTDMYGNTYYQVYDSDGFQLKREVKYGKGFHNSVIDPIWVDWLNGKEKLPPSKTEIEQSFEGYLKRKTIGEEYDKRDEEMMAKFREAMKKVAKPKKKEFEPATWKPDLGPKKNY
jgi:NADH:ubiquinone oxidoreductase subunit